ncbi:MAG: GNAT family N-acetyltransferase [Acidobacteriota bacterium]
MSTIARVAKAHWGYPQAWLDAWHDQLTITPADLDRFEIVGAWLDATHDDGLVAFLALSLDARGEEGEIEHLWVDPAAMGNGIGRALVEHANARARRRGARRLRIESDPYAEAFYARLGARRIGEVSRPVLGEARLLPLLVMDL